MLAWLNLSQREKASVFVTVRMSAMTVAVVSIVYTSSISFQQPISCL